jgi:anthranilate phosphoribosyltransferase
MMYKVSRNSEFIKDAVNGKLDFERAYELALIMRELDDLHVASILSAIEARGYDSEVVAGFAKAIRDSAIKLENVSNVADTCGTGGDGARTINVSTAASIALSHFYRVAKHGNRSVTSSSGSADVLEAMGINIFLQPEIAKNMLEKTNFAFLFAPLYHPAFARVASVRKKLGIRTIFNLTGPLSNPANPKYQMIGVSDGNLIEVMAGAMEILGVEGVVIYGGIDEVNPAGETTVLEVRNGTERFKVTPEDFGMKRERIIPCTSAEESARRIEAVFNGNGMKEDETFIALNFSMALFVTGKDNLKENIEIFRNSIEEGTLARKLEEIKCLSTSLLNL